MRVISAFVWVCVVTTWLLIAAAWILAIVLLLVDWGVVG